MGTTKGTKLTDYLSFRLPDHFLEPYKNKPVKWGFEIGAGNSLSELTFIAKYSRKKADGTKEQWWECTQRCVEGMYSILKDWCKHNRTPWNEFKAQKSAQEAFAMMFDFKWTPPGRGLANMGTEMVHMEQNNASLNNCFVGSEKFLTRNYGPTRFDEVVGQEVEVATTNGWELATVQNFGVQTVQRITFKPFGINSNLRHTITATPNHRWILKDDSETTELKPGDYVKGNFATSERPLYDDYWDGLLHGIIFGDGTQHPHVYANGDLRFQIHACDDRIEQTLLLPKIKSRLNTFFEQNGDYHASIRTTKNLKSFPVSESENYIRGFIHGWITADGTCDKRGGRGYVLASQNPLAQEWLTNWAAFGGFSYVGVNADSITTTNFGQRKNPCFRHTLKDSTQDWTVVSVETLDAPEEVYCAVVPQSRSFTLANGIYTGNCAAVSTEKLSSHSFYAATMPFTRLMEMSMHGVGVGFDTRGAGKLTIHEPDANEKVVVTIGDTREDWAKSVGILLDSYFFKSRPTVEFDYSEIRPAGAPLKRFGGHASGPEPLEKLHKGIRKIFLGRDNDKITSRDIVDIMNMIGKAVVAGGARRSALIALGEATDDDYVNLKNWELPENEERTGADGWAWTSNNSVYANADDDLGHLVNKIAINGEPGVIYLDVMQNYGRLADPQNGRDYRATLVNPCAEISLEPHEFCCLSELYPANHETFAEFERSIKHAYMYAKAVTLMPSVWPETNEVITRNRRIGVSMTGIVEFLETRSWSEMKTWMDAGYAKLRNLDTTYSEWLGVRESIKVSTVKPAGTTSIIAGTTSGVHWPTTSGFYIRRQRFLKHDPIVEAIIAAGYHVEPDVMDPEQTVVASFPTKGLSVRSELEVSVWEKAHLAAMAQRYWADNMVSVTVSFDKDDEAKEIEPLLRSLQGQLKSVSFLPISSSGTSYAQAPFEPIDQEDAVTYQKNMKRFNMNKLYGKSSLEAEGEKFCTNDSCVL